MTDDEELSALYAPTTGMIACVLLQAACGASQGVANMFPCEDWETSPSGALQRFKATRKQWRFIASLSKEERIRRWEAKE